jgi:hypothetical protein
MSWVATEDFSYSPAGTVVAGQTGGSGWSDAWANVDNGFVTSSTAYTGSFSASYPSWPDVSGNEVLTRTLTSTTTSGHFTVAIRRSDKTSGEAQTTLRDAALLTGVRLTMNTADIVLTGATTVTLVSGYSVNQWYFINLQYDTSSSGTYSAAVNGGSQSSTVAGQNTITNVAKIRFNPNGTNTGTFFADNIGGSIVAAARTSDFFSFFDELNIG